MSTKQFNADLATVVKISHRITASELRLVVATLITEWVGRGMRDGASKKTMLMDASYALLFNAVNACGASLGLPMCSPTENTEACLEATKAMGLSLMSSDAGDRAKIKAAYDHAADMHKRKN